jgi:hypothetical protein
MDSVRSKLHVLFMAIIGCVLFYGIKVFVFDPDRFLIIHLMDGGLICAPLLSLMVSMGLNLQWFNTPVGKWWYWVFTSVFLCVAALGWLGAAIFIDEFGTQNVWLNAVIGMMILISISMLVLWRNQYMRWMMRGFFMTVVGYFILTLLNVVLMGINRNDILGVILFLLKYDYLEHLLDKNADWLIYLVYSFFILTVLLQMVVGLLIELIVYFVAFIRQRQARIE